MTRFERGREQSIHDEALADRLVSGYRARLVPRRFALVRRTLERAPLRAGMRVLDVGFSTLEFRTVVQPHIDRNVFFPLRQRGLTVTHLDARAEPGVDIVSDVASLEAVDQTYDVVVCTSLLEHVVDRSGTIANLKRVVSPSGLLVLTVPRQLQSITIPSIRGFVPAPASCKSSSNGQTFWQKRSSRYAPSFTMPAGVGTAAFFGPGRSHAFWRKNRTPPSQEGG